MKPRTTLILLLAVLVLGCFIWFVERRTESTLERREQARRAVQVKADRISYLRLETTNLVAECAREGGVWMIVQPVRARADQAQIDRILSGLESLPRGEVITAADRRRRGLAYADYGLDQPRARIGLGDSLHRQTLLVGRVSSLGGSVYIRDEQRDDIVATDTNLLTLLPASVSDVRDRMLLAGSPERVERIDISSGGGFIQLGKRDQGQWMIQQPLRTRASAAAAQGLLRELFDVRADEFVTDSGTDVVPYGLDEPRVQVGLWLGEKQGEVSLLLGNAAGADGSRVYAKLKSEPSIYAVSSNILTRLRPALDDLRDKRLIPLASYDIGYIRLQEGEKAVGLRRADGGWNIVEPEPWEADDQRVRDLLMAWSGATIVGYLDGQATNLAAFGLEPPFRTLTFARVPPPAEPQADPREPADSGVVRVLVSQAPRDLGRLLVKLEPEEPLYEILLDVQKTVSLDPLFYRQRKVLGLGAEDVTGVEVRKGSTEKKVRREASGAFVPVAPAAGAVDAEAVRDMLRAASDLRVLRFVADGPGDLAPFGLEDPRAVITFVMGGDAGISKSILLGRPAGEDGTYAMLRGQDVVFVLETGVCDKLLQEFLEAPSAPQEVLVDGVTNKPAP